MITYTYEILQLICEQKIDGKPDAVSGVHLRISATENSITRSSVVYIPIELDSETGFTEYNQLTEATIRSWIDAKTELMDNYKLSVAALLLEASDPITVNRQPPWATVPTTTAQPAYQIQRSINYPAFGDQLDMLWHAMDAGELTKVTSFYDAIKAVKDQFPKI